jgi:ligand-binding SRPBCC domain-containing protein
LPLRRAIVRPRGNEFALERTQVLARPLEEIFDFFSHAENLALITPSWLAFEILEAPDRIDEGSCLRYRIRLLGVPVLWHTEIVAAWKPPRTFTDVQTAGPYALWEHTHRFTPVPGGTEVYDHVRYGVPGGPLAPLVQRLFVGPRLEEIFDYRSGRLAEIFRAGNSSANSVRSA